MGNKKVKIHWGEYPVETTKKFSESEIENLAGKFKILSEQSRLKILSTLFITEKCVNDIIEETDLLQANVSKQLKILADNKIVSCRKDGLKRYYKVIDPIVFQICEKICSEKENNLKK